MARKTFISYKYSESQEIRNKILEALGEDATYYKGETADSPNQTDNKTETIKKNLKDMIFDTSVTIVVISPNMVDSKWIDWEIEYSLKEITRGERTSKSNGILGVIARDFGSYEWFKTIKHQYDGCSIAYYETSKTYKVINKNRFNLKKKVYTCSNCKSVDEFKGCYISFVQENDFLNNPQKYIENAYTKSQDIDKYEIVKEVSPKEEKSFSDLHLQQKPSNIQHDAQRILYLRQLFL